MLKLEKSNFRVVCLVPAIVMLLFVASCSGQNDKTQTVGGVASSAQSTGPNTASVSSLVLGNSVGTDYKIKSPSSEFQLSDLIYASSMLATTDTAKSVPAEISVKWTNVDTGKVVKAESRKLDVMNSNMLNFAINAADGMTAGKFTAQVFVNGKLNQSKAFTVK